MKWLLFITVYSSIVISGLIIDNAQENVQQNAIVIEELQKENRQLSKIVSARETIKQKRIELDYLWPIHIEDWIPGPSRLTSPFGERDDSEAGGLSDGYHEGDDMWGVNHSKETWLARPVAITSGWVEHWLNDPIKGEYILLHHDDGNESEYHHLSKAYVLDGDKVIQGQVLGRIGNTGISTGPHLHFQLTINGKLVNPLKYIEIPKE